MSNSWDFYFANVNDLIASISVDLGVREAVPDRRRPWLLWAWVYFQEPRDDGLSSAAEAPTLHAIEDALSRAVKTATGAELVGRITTAGRREFYFYGPRPAGFEAAVTDALADFPGYEFDLGTKDEPGWEQYLTCLYPAPDEYQRIKNRHVVEALMESGDALEDPRPVSHWAYFRSRRDRDDFAARAADAGFAVVQENEADDRGAERPFGVTLERTDAVDWHSINEVTDGLLYLAGEFDGSYDGWETPLVKGGI